MPPALGSAAPSPPKRARVAGVDVARGLASLIMIQGHAYDGWCSPEAKQTAAYAFTRLLGSLPLPAFLALAGAAIVLRVEAAIERGQPAAGVRHAVATRGLTVLGFGYATNVAYALMDGWEHTETLLRADVLHVIGLSIVAFSLLGIRGDGPGAPPQRARLLVAALLLFVVPTALCPWLSPLGASSELPWSAALGLFVDAPGITRMPFVPLVSWLALGALASLAMRRASRDERDRAAGAPRAFFVAMLLGALAVAFAAHTVTGAMVSASGAPLTRAHPAVWANVADLGARALVVLGVAGLMTPHLPARARSLLVRVGQGSLLAYIVHIPFCYGRVSRSIAHRLSMTEATLGVALLMVASVAVVLGRDWLRLIRRQRAANEVAS